MKAQARRIGTLSMAFLASSNTGCSAEKSLISTRAVSNLAPTPTSTPIPVPSAFPVPGDANSKPAEGTSLPASCSRPGQAAKQNLNVPYQSIDGVDSNFLSLDIYMPAVANPCQGVPMVIWVHGGAWMIGDKANIDSSVKARHFNSMGYGFISVNYRLSPVLRTNQPLNPDRIKFPDHPNDVGAAVAWVHKNISGQGGDPQKLALLGHSAGAHLAALVALDQRFIEKADSTWNAKSLRCLGSYDTEGYNINEFMRTATGQSRLIYSNAFGDEAAVWTAASPLGFIKNYGMAVQLAKRGDLDRHNQLENFKRVLGDNNNSVSVIDAQSISHEEVNRLIGVTDDQIMTPFVSKFLSENCFPK
jgi:arylformamidase